MVLQIREDGAVVTCTACSGDGKLLDSPCPLCEGDGGFSVPVVNVAVRTVAGKELRLQEISTIGDIKAAVAEHWKVPYDFQQLLCDHCGLLVQVSDNLEDHILEDIGAAFTMTVSLESVRNQLKHGDAEKRLSALASLAELGFKGGPRSVAAVVACATAAANDSKVRSAAVRTLPRVATENSEIAATGIKLSLADADAEVRNAALEVITEIFDEQEGIAIACSVLGTASSDEVRRSATEALVLMVQTRQEQAIEALTDNLRRNTSLHVKASALEALAQVAVKCKIAENLKSQAQSEIHRSLNDSSECIKRSAVRALGELAKAGDPKAIRTIMLCVKDDSESASVKHVAEQVLAHLPA